MQNYRDLIIGPILTEKSSTLANSNKLVLKVKKSADKTTLKIAVEKIFGVKVLEVRTINVEGKKKRVGRFEGKKSDYKKAIITLEEGQNINLG